MSDTRFQQGDVTETLVKATELVTELGVTDAMVVLYTRHKDSETYSLRIVCSDDITIETANWLLDKAKFHLLCEKE